MDSLQDILSKTNFKPPDEINIVKDYIQRRYQQPCSLKVERDVLVLTVKGSSLAATIQMERQRLIEECGLTKRLVIRAGR